MTVRTAKLSLTVLWGLAVIPLLLILVLRQLAGFFEADGQVAWTWVAQYVLPGVTLIGGAWTVAEPADVGHGRVSPVVFWGAFVLSAFYLVLLFLVLAALAHGSIRQTVEGSGLFLGLIQGVVVGWLGKFFIEAKR